jgi:PAS domain S-box-containing protein
MHLLQTGNVMGRPTIPNQITEEGESINASFAGFDSLEVCMLGLIPDGKIVYANQAACDMLGYPKEKLVGIPFQTIAPKMTNATWSGFWSGVDRKGGGEHQTTLTIRQYNQEELQVRCRALRVQAAGQAGCVMFLSKPGVMPIALVDVQAQRAQMVQILDVMSNPVISLDGQHKITFMNKAACILLRTTVDECIGKTVFDYLPQKYAEIFWNKEQEALDNGRPATYAVDSFMQNKFGGPITFLPFTDPKSSQKRILVVIDNAPDPFQLPALKTENDESLYNSPKLQELRRYIDKGDVGIYLKDPENKIVWLNQSYADMLGFEPKDLVGKRVDDLVNDPELMAKLRQEDETVLSTGRPLFNLVKQPKRDQPKFIRIDKLPFIDKNRKITGIIGLAVEISAPDPNVHALQEKLASTSRKLEETETALRVLLDHRERDASLTKEKLGERIKGLVLPYLENLKQNALQPDQIEYIALIEENLKNFYDPNYAKLSGPEYKLSPTELKVAQLVRDGKTNKEIAQIMHLSKSTILTHRHHVRAKLGIRNKKVNLRSLLKS